jgi:hypothetical protein
MDLAEDRVVLYGDAIETGREQRYNMRVTSHTSALKDRQSGMRVVYPARWWPVVRRIRLMVSWDTRVPSGNLAQGLVVFTDAAYHVWSFFTGDAVLRLTWTRMLV